MINTKICRLRCVMLMSAFILNIIESSNTKNQESYISNQDTMTSLKDIQ